MTDETYFGPYRATKLWNELIRTFRTGVPVGRHRRYMKTYDDCFIASVAIEWMNEHLRNNVNFGSSVTRPQTVQLLQKFHKSRVFEDVRSDNKYNRVDFTDGGRLFRIIYSSPSPVKTYRAPLTSRTNLNHTITTGKNNVVPKLESKPSLSKSLITPCRLVTRELTLSESKDVWKSVALQRLQSVLGISQLSEILDENLVSGANIQHNCTYINKNGVVTNIDSKDQLPHWALSAMRCLAHWPDRVDDHLPIYPGFERDIFRVIKDYFDSLSEPLLTYDMYEVITNVFVEADRTGLKPRHISATVDLTTPATLASFESVEHLIMDLTMNNESPKPDFDMNSNDSTQSYGLNTNIDCLDNIAFSTDNSSSRVETVFGPNNNNEIVTKVHQRNQPIRRVSPAYVDNKQPSVRCGRDITQSMSYSTLPRNIRDDTRLNKHQSNQSYGLTVALVKSDRDQPKSDKNYKRCFSNFDNPSYCHDENIDCTHVISQKQASQKFNSIPPPDFGLPPYVPPPKYKKRRDKLSTTRNANDTTFHVTRVYCDDNRGDNSRRSVLRRRSSSFSDLKADIPVFTLPEKRLNKSLYRSTPVLTNKDRVQRVTDALQLSLLLLPPANRRKLHLLLRLMYKMCHNVYLHLSASTPLRTLVLESFYRSIIASSDPSDIDELLSIQIVTFLVDHYAEVLAVSEQVRTDVDSRLNKVTKTECKADGECGCTYRNENNNNETNVSRRDPNLTISCHQVSQIEYEQNKSSLSHSELVQLLDALVNSTHLSNKEKRKKLTEFSRSHPEVYRQRFPTSTSVEQLLPNKKHTILARPLNRLRNIRL